MSQQDPSGGRDLIALLLSPFTATIASPLRFARWLIQWTSWWSSTSRRRLMVICLAGLMTLSWVGTRTSVSYTHLTLPTICSV